jgi:acetyl-CoA carboxylase biotin carboxyl carrier protein
MKPDDLKPYSDFMERHSLEYLEVRKGDFRLVMRKAGSAAGEEIGAPAPAGGPAKEAVLPADAARIAAPLVGIFYRASSPGSAPFVEVGSRVGPDDVLCIIEAMKVMNEIKSEVSGVVKEILVENGKPVEYGQVLFLIERS